MESVRINVSMPKNVFRELSQEVESRKRSRFITEAIMRLVKHRFSRNEKSISIKRLEL